VSLETSPPEADLYVDNNYLGKSPLTHTFKFSKTGETFKITARKYGYEPMSASITRDFESKEMLIKLKKLKKRKLAYAVPIVKEGEIRFSLVYEYGYYETIENSPNALNVQRIMVTDDVDELIGKLDVSNNMVVFSKIFPQKPINTEQYVRNLDLFADIIDKIDRIIQNNDKTTIKNLIEKLQREKNDYMEVLEGQYGKVLSFLQNEAATGKKTITFDSGLTDELKARYKELLSLKIKDTLSEIWMVSLKGGFSRFRLTNSNKRWTDLNPSITSDGKYVYFSSNRNGKDTEIWRISPSGGMGITRITNSPFSEDYAPSVDGENDLVAYISVPVGSFNAQIWTIKSNGSLPSQLRVGDNVDICRDGTKIIFTRSNEERKKQIWSMNTDGSGETLLTSNSKTAEEFPHYSPDCEWVVYVSEESGNKDIYVMRADGSEKIQLTTNPSVDTFPVWGDDGYIYFVSNRGLLWGIWRLKPNFT
jgi:hypothetical protein